MKLVFWHWFWLSFMLLLWSSQGLSSDGLALLALSKSLILPSSLRSNWTASDATPCAWNGVGCNGRNRVIYLDLSSSGISGSIGPEIGHLKYLQNLSLSANNISGSIPPELGNLKKLSLLSLYQNSLSGTIPYELFRNQLLEKVYLNSNQLTGLIPFSVGEMINLKSLWLNENMLSGVLPRSIGNCTKLEELYLHDNQLSGSLPEALSEIKGLRILDATNNRFTGKILFSFENCKLEIFNLSFNNIKGEIPAWLGNCMSLQQLVFVSNSFNSLVVLGAWSIWTHRNACVFDGATPSISRALSATNDERHLWEMAGARCLSSLTSPVHKE